MAIPAVASLQQHNARRDIVIELAARRRAAIEARGHSELRAQSGRKNPPACRCATEKHFTEMFVCHCSTLHCLRTVPQKYLLLVITKCCLLGSLFLHFCLLI